MFIDIENTSMESVQIWTEYVIIWVIFMMSLSIFAFREEIRAGSDEHVGFEILFGAVVC